MMSEESARSQSQAGWKVIPHQVRFQSRELAASENKDQWITISESPVGPGAQRLFVEWQYGGRARL